jgi:hypothetical protein
MARLGRPPGPLRSWFSLAALAAAALAAGCAPAPGGGTALPTNAEVYAAWQQHRSPVEVTALGTVVKVLGIRSGRSGRHEGFLVHLSGNESHDLTIRVEDNVDLTGPIPLRSGDSVELRGEYIFDPRGGILHYTHRDPRGRHPNGYVRVNGRTYS